jgi:hypothetical protein
MRVASREILRENALMATTTESIEERNRTIRPDHERFVDRHRPVLLRYLDGTAPVSTEEPDALGYVERVLTEWRELFDESNIGEPTREERTFWYALYQLEELAELPSPHSDPYEELLLENLVEVRELLRNRQPLPEHRFMATRPDGA